MQVFLLIRCIVHMSDYLLLNYGVPLGSKVCIFSGTKNNFSGTNNNISGTKNNFSPTIINFSGIITSTGDELDIKY